MTTPDYTGGNGIPIPLLPSALGSTSAAIATGISDAGEPDPISVRRRWGVILAINADSTVDIDLGGVTVPHVSYDASYHPAVSEVVQVNVVDTDITVIGPTANSTYVSYVRRTGTIVKVNTAADAPGAPTSVNVTLSDAQDPVSILNVPYVSPYFPTVGDEVMLGQGTNTNVYLVLGAVNRTFRRPTGDVEPTILATAKPNTLICNGQAVSRTTYAALWAWVQLNGLVTGGLFGNGNGTSTFTVPDFRGRVPVGVGTLGSDTYALGATGGNARTTLATDQMPVHDHNVSVAVAAHGTHDHGVTTTVGSGGGHFHNSNFNTGNAGGHFHNVNINSAGESGHSHGLPVAHSTAAAHNHSGSPGWVAEQATPFTGPAGATSSGGSTGHFHTVAGPTSTDATHAHTVSGPTDTTGAHTHTATTDVTAVSAGTHAPTVTESTVGGTTAVDLRSPYIAINWLVWV